jgi:rsbT co-antagonist protein RsbR
MQAVRSYDDTQVERFRQFVFWSIVASACFSPAYLAAYLFIPNVVIAIAGISIFGFLLACLLVQLLLRRHELAKAVVLYSISLQLTMLIVALIIPSTYPTLVIGVILTVVIALMYTNGKLQLYLLSTNIIAIVAVSLICEFVQLFPANPAEVIVPLRIIASLTLATLIIWLLRQFSLNLKASLAEAQSANTALQAIQITLENQVADRTIALQRALDTVQEREGRLVETLTTLQMSQQVIHDLSVPVLPVSHDTLVMPLIGTLDSARMLQVQEQALSRIALTHARHLLLDITGVPVVDSHVAQGLLKVVQSSRLIGADVVVVGIRPEVAQTIVGLGLDLSGIRTYTDIQSALSRIVI